MAAEQNAAGQTRAPADRAGRAAGRAGAEVVGASRAAHDRAAPGGRRAVRRGVVGQDRPPARRRAVGEMAGADALAARSRDRDGDLPARGDDMAHAAGRDHSTTRTRSSASWYPTTTSGPTRRYCSPWLKLDPKFERIDPDHIADDYGLAESGKPIDWRALTRQPQLIVRRYESRRAAALDAAGTVRPACRRSGGGRRGRAGRFDDSDLEPLTAASLASEADRLGLRASAAAARPTGGARGRRQARDPHGPARHREDDARDRACESRRARRSLAEAISSRPRPPTGRPTRRSADCTRPTAATAGSRSRTATSWRRSRATAGSWSTS